MKMSDLSIVHNENMIIVYTKNEFLFAINKMRNGMDRLEFNCPNCSNNTLVLYFGDKGVYNCNEEPIIENIMSICEMCWEAGQ